MTQHKLPPPAPFPPGIGFNPKPGLDGKGDMGDHKKSGRQHRRNLASPCDRPPAAPTGVKMIFRAIEAKTHLNFKGRIVWDDVTTDTSGITINTVDRWDIEWRAVDDDGDPVEVEHSALTRAWTPGTTLSDHFNVITCSNPSGTTYRINTAAANDYRVGDDVRVENVTPAAYNGTWRVTDRVDSNSIEVAGDTSSVADGGAGDVYAVDTSIYHFKTARNISPAGPTGYEWHVGDRVKVRGCAPETNYNGTYTIASIVGADEFTVNHGIAGTPDAKNPGEVYNLASDQSYRRKLRQPQPRMPLRKAEMIIGTSDHSAITAAHNPSGTTYRFTTGQHNDYIVGDYVKIENASPGAYNGVWHVTNRVDADTFEVLGDTSSVAAGTTADAYIATTIFEFTTRGTNGFNNGDRVRVVGNRPEVDFNGTYDITATPGDDKFRVEPNRHPNQPLNNAETLGVVYDHTDALHLVLPHIPRPKTWSWQARVRARSGEGCWSAFSPWTTPILPWEGAEPKPPIPTYGLTPITFDHKGKGKHRKIRLLFTFDEVEDWDVPGGDRESDVKSYTVQLDHSADGVNWDTTRQGGSPFRTHSKPAKDDDDTGHTVTAVFHNDIHRQYWYRCRVRTVDRFSRRGDWSEWTDPALPFDDISPPTPLDVEVFPASTDRVVVAWNDPSIALPCVGTVSGTSGTATLTGTGTQFKRQVEAGTVIKIAATYADLGTANEYTVKKVTSATSLTLTSNLLTSPTDDVLWEVADDPDVAHYGVQIAKFADVNTGVSPNEWTDVYANDRTVGQRKAFKIPDRDTDETFFARVRSVDAAGNKSVWIPAWIRTQHSDAANSDPDVDGDGVVVIPGSSAITTEWVHSGKLSVDSADQDEDGDTTDHIADPYEIPSRFENQTGVKLWFKNVTLNCGDRDAGTGAPTGTGIIVQMRRWNTDGVTADVMFSAGGPDNRPRINTGEYHGSKGVADFAVTHLDPGEAVSCTLFQYGSTNPGSNLHVTLTMSAAAPVEH